MFNEYEEVIDLIKSKGLEADLLQLEGLRPIHAVKVAYLKKSESSKSKDFTFDFQDNKTFYMFITITNNPNFCKPNSKDSNTLGSNPNNLANTSMFSPTKNLSETKPDAVPAPSESAEEKPNPKPKRASVPSWDEILFGSGSKVNE